MGHPKKQERRRRRQKKIIDAWFRFILGLVMSSKEQERYQNLISFSIQLLPSFFCGVFSLVGYHHLLVPFLISICNIYEKSIWNNTCNIEKRKKEKEVLPM